MDLHPFAQLSVVTHYDPQEDQEEQDLLLQKDVFDLCKYRTGKTCINVYIEIKVVVEILWMRPELN